MDRQEAIEKFRYHWRLLSETENCDCIEKQELYHHLRSETENDSISHCFLCDYDNNDCSLCPIQWVDENCFKMFIVMNRCPCVEGLYRPWCCRKTPEERKEIAKKISELPERVG